MGLRAREFDNLHSDNKLRIVNIKGIPVMELKQIEDKNIILYSVYNFFVEAIIDRSNGNILGIERLTLDQVALAYC